MLVIHEIFRTIQGEGYDTGIPCTFIRLFGCKLKCAYCDQPQKSEDARQMSIEEIMEIVDALGVKNICITGGEPLQQENVYNLIDQLVLFGYNVSIETNGSILVRDTKDRQYKYVLDIKCPSSREDKSNRFENLHRLNENDEVKFVIADKSDYYYMRAVLEVNPTKAKVLLSPMFDHNLKQTIGKDLCDWVLDDNLDVRIQIQLHKILGVM